MKTEVESAVNFLTQLMRNSAKSEDALSNFNDILKRRICEHYQNHWFPLKPFKGSGYRCLRLNHKMYDDVILKAAEEAGLTRTDLIGMLPNELTLWIDPREVSYRIGEDGSVGIIYEDDSPPTTPTVDNHNAINNLASKNQNQQQQPHQGRQSVTPPPVPAPVIPVSQAPIHHHHQQLQQRTSPIPVSMSPYTTRTSPVPVTSSPYSLTSRTSPVPVVMTAGSPYGARTSPVPVYNPQQQHTSPMTSPSRSPVNSRAQTPNSHHQQQQLFNSSPSRPSSINSPVTSTNNGFGDISWDILLQPSNLLAQQHIQQQFQQQQQQQSCGREAYFHQHHQASSNLNETYDLKRLAAYVYSS